MEQGTTGSLVFRDLFASVKAKEIVGRMGMIAYDQRTNALYIHTDEKWVPYERPEEAEQRRQRERPVSDLVAWIRAQLDEDERVARACPGPIWEHRQVKGAFDEDVVFEDYVAVADAQDRTVLSDVDEDVLPYVLRFDPAAVLADVEAKRAILDEHSPKLVEAINADGDERSGLWCDECDYEEYPCRTVRHLAEGFRGRPGYEEACGE